MTAPTLLQVQQLHIRLPTAQGLVEAVRGLDFTLAPGSSVGLVGESGCGKTLTALALMGLLPASAQVSGSIRLLGQELLGLDEASLCHLRGNRMAMVFQEPMTALNPLHSIGHQVAEPLRLHQGLSQHAARAAALELLERVGIAQAASRLGQYPHQFSGGQRQRIAIAMALACQPALLLADEPTTALDVTVQQQILQLIQDLVQEHHMGLLLVSHDLALIARSTSQLLVMYGGSVLERGPTTTVLQQPAHPYTRGLLAARPRLIPHRAGAPRPLPTLAGSVPALADLPTGCPFAGRCEHTQASCWHSPPPEQPLATNGHRARCLRPEVLARTWTGGGA